MLRRRRTTPSPRLLFALPLALGLVVVPIVGGMAAAHAEPASAAIHRGLSLRAADPNGGGLLGGLLGGLVTLQSPDRSADPAPAPSATPAPSAPAPSAPPSSAPAPAPSPSAPPASPAPAPTAAPAQPAPSSSPTAAPAPISASTRFQAEVVRLVNEARAQNGLGALTVDSRLTDAAARHAVDQARMQQGGHVGSDGTRGGDRITQAGYRWCSWGENVAWGYTTPRAVVDAWMASESHRANILKARFVHIGLATAVGEDGRTYWAQEFGAPC